MYLGSFSFLHLIWFDLTVVDPMESIEDYVIVPGPPMDLPSLGHAFKPSQSPSKYGSAPSHSGNVNSRPSSPLPIIGGRTGRFDRARGIESRLSAPGISHGSVNKVVNLEQPSSDYMTRISSLQRFAAAITELVNDEVTCRTLFKAYHNFSEESILFILWSILF